MMALLGTEQNWAAWYSDYRKYGYYAERAAWVHSVQPTGKILVAGAGFGYLVDELQALGRDAYGFDAADYCIAQATRQLAKASILSRTQMAAAKNATGAGQKVPCIVTEDLLPCLTDAEITTALTEARLVATRLLHIITPGDPNDPAKVAGLNWKSHAEWKALVSTDLVYNAEGGAVL